MLLYVLKSYFEVVGLILIHCSTLCKSEISQRQDILPHLCFWYLCIFCTSDLDLLILGKYNVQISRKKSKGVY